MLILTDYQIVESWSCIFYIDPDLDCLPKYWILFLHYFYIDLILILKTKDLIFVSILRPGVLILIFVLNIPFLFQDWLVAVIPMQTNI